MNKKLKPLSEMNTAELREATKEYDKEFIFLEGKPLTAADKAMFKRSQANAKAKARGGRPVIGKGAERINISVERDLLKKADAVAKRAGIKRSELIAEGLRLVIQRKSA